jgi:hypothetical protein
MEKRQIMGKAWENQGKTSWVCNKKIGPRSLEIDFVILCASLCISLRGVYQDPHWKGTVKIPTTTKMRSTKPTVHDVHSTVEGRYNRMDMQWDAEPM